MSNIIRTLSLISFVTLTSCSLFTSKQKSNESIVEVTAVPPTIIANPAVLLIPNEIKGIEREIVHLAEEPVISRPKLGPFTHEQSANIVISEYKNNLLFEDLNISHEELASDFHYPVASTLSSPYGWRHGRMHSGADLRAPRGTEIHATFDGVVRFAKYYAAYGNCIVIRHYNGLETVYAHASKMLVEVNQEVKGGDVIALVGRTGRATGDHLHFEVRVAGQTINPNLILNTVDNTLQDKNLYVSMRSGRIFASNSEARTTRENEVKEIASVKYHIVRSGDTLSRIAANNRTTVTNLCRMNNISSTSTLNIGQRVRVQ